MDSRITINPPALIYPIWIFRNVKLLLTLHSSNAESFLAVVI